MQIKHYLNQTKDIVYLLSFVLKKSIGYVYAYPEYSLNSKQQQQLKQYILQLNKGIPLAYIIGEKSFYGLSFKVDHNVLIPRNETELLIDIALDVIKENNIKSILDLGCGSGIIGISLQHQLPNIKVSMSDNCNKALHITKKNAKQLLNNHSIQFITSDWLYHFTKQQFDLIISNPPYINKKDKHLQQLSHEPQHALVANKNGLANFITINEQAPKFLTDNGFLLLEHGYNQQQSLIEILKNFKIISLHNDLSGNNRAVLAQKIKK